MQVMCKACIRPVHGMYKVCTWHVQGMFQECTRHFKGICKSLVRGFLLIYSGSCIVPLLGKKCSYTNTKPHPAAEALLFLSLSLLTGGKALSLDPPPFPPVGLRCSGTPT